MRLDPATWVGKKSRVFIKFKTHDMSIKTHDTRFKTGTSTNMQIETFDFYCLNPLTKEYRHRSPLVFCGWFLQFTSIFCWFHALIICFTYFKLLGVRVHLRMLMSKLVIFLAKLLLDVGLINLESLLKQTPMLILNRFCMNLCPMKLMSRNPTHVVSFNPSTSELDVQFTVFFLWTLNPLYIVWIGLLSIL